jgi:hypothetical protein
MSFCNRRKFLSQLGAAGFTGTALLGTSAESAESGDQLHFDRRAEEALRLRIEIAKIQRQTRVSPQETNGESEKYPSQLANFSKGFRLGEVVAISLMEDLLSVTAENQLPLTFHKFSGELVTIHPSVQ